MADVETKDTAGHPPAPAMEMYQAELPTVPTAISALLEKYSGIPPEEQNRHIVQFRDRAYESHPYPCLGRWRFLELDLAGHPLYPTVLAALKEKGDWIFLDLGCCLGQEIRKLIYDGADPSRLYGADLRPEFVDIGYQFFRDEHKFPRDHFIAPADVFDFAPDTELATKCDGKVGILNASAVFHLFSLAEQKTMASRVLRLMDPNAVVDKSKRVLICGGQVGNVNPSEYPRARGGGSRFRHDGDSWREMWQQVISQDEWKDKIRAVDVHTDMEERVIRRRKGSGKEGDAGAATAGEEEMINFQRQMGRIEDGFRWMKYWVWIEFA